MPNYVTKKLHKFQHRTPRRTWYAPHQWTRPNYGEKKQPGTNLDTSLPIQEEEKRMMQKIVGTLLYYFHNVELTMLPSLITISDQQSNPTQNTEAEIKKI